jgi:hypothetical protein
MTDGELEGMALDAHLAAAHGVAADFAGLAHDTGLTGKAEIIFEVLFSFGGGRKEIHAGGHLDHALLAFAIFVARSWNGHAQLLSMVEEGLPRFGLRGVPIDGETGGHWLYFTSWPRLPLGIGL